jgi:hypothetical protein
MNESQSQFQFLQAAVNLQRMEGKRSIKRRDLVASILVVNPQSSYGCNSPFGANFTKHLRIIANQSGAQYVKDKNGKNARLEF